MDSIKKIGIIFVLVIFINVLAYLIFYKQAYRVSLTLFATGSVLSIIGLFTMIITLLVLLFLSLSHMNIYGTLKLIKMELIWTSALTLLLVLQVVVSQYMTYTPDVKSKDGISVIEKVNINGTTQWMSIRTENKENPVLLFLAGGPGGSQLNATSSQLRKLESHFTVINWEQPGVGKSYNARDIDKLTPELYVEDAHALTLLIKERFNQDKIYLMGQSWGSYLGMVLSATYPSDYHAFIGSGQMVDFTETEQYCYDLALSIAKEKNDTKQIKALENMGRPPIYGDNVTMEIGSYLMYLRQEMQSNPDIYQTDFDTIDEMLSPEYGIWDKFNFIRGLYVTFSHVYQQLYGTDFRQSHTEFEIPIYIFHGRHDINAPGYLVEDYFNQIEAPNKELVWFEHSGHMPWQNENELFVEKTIELFLNK